MKIAVVGSRDLHVENLGAYIPEEVTEIISGGARGIDMDARTYALQHGIQLTEIRPEYKRYGRAAPLYRNIEIIERAELVIAFWDGRSRGTRFVVEACKKRGVPVQVFTP